MSDSITPSGQRNPESGILISGDLREFALKAAQAVVKGQLPPSLPLAPSGPPPGNARPVWAGRSANGFYRNLAPVLADGGYEPVPIPAGFKYPMGLPQWQSCQLDGAQDVFRLLNQHPEFETADVGVGLRCGLVRAIDLDITDPILAEVMFQWILRKLKDRGKSLGVGNGVGVRVGQWPKRLMLFQVDHKRGVNTVKQVSNGYRVPGRQDINRIEVMGKGQQVVISGLHPGTGQPYHWYGDPPWLGKKPTVGDLPVLSAQFENELIAEFERVCKMYGLEAVSGSRASGASGLGPGGSAVLYQWGTDSECQKRVQKNLQKATPDWAYGADGALADLREWLSWFDPRPRDMWVTVGHWVKAMVREGVLPEEVGFGAFCEWGMAAGDGLADGPDGQRWLWDGLVASGESRCGADRLFREWARASGQEGAARVPGWLGRGGFDQVKDPTNGVEFGPVSGVLSSDDQQQQQDGLRGANGQAVRDFERWSPDEFGALARSTPWLLDGLVPARGVGILFGESKSYKSFVALDLSLALIYGRDVWGAGRVLWGRRVSGPWGGSAPGGGRVLYLAMEASQGLHKRVRGWLETAKSGGWALPPAPEAFVTRGGVPVNLSDEPLSSVLMGTIQADQSRYGPLSLVVVDTLAQAHGGEENSAQDVGRLLQVCTRISELAGCFVLLVHHVGHLEKGRMRGSSALEANVDFALRAEKVDGAPGVVEVTNTKQKDDEAAEAFFLRTEKSSEWLSQEGEVLGSLVLRHDPVFVKPDPTTDLSQIPPEFADYPLVFTEFKPPATRTYEAFGFVRDEVARTQSTIVTLDDIRDVARQAGYSYDASKRLKGNLQRIADRTNYFSMSQDGTIEWHCDVPNVPE